MRADLLKSNSKLLRQNSFIWGYTVGSNISFSPNVPQQNGYNSFATNLSSPMEGSLDRLPSGPTMRVLGPRLISDAANDSFKSFEGVIGESLPLKNVMEQVRTVAPTDSTVLIQGETGTGKELIARAIHSQSARRDRKFVRLNCAA